MTVTYADLIQIGILVVGIIVTALQKNQKILLKSAARLRRRGREAACVGLHRQNTAHEMGWRALPALKIGYRFSSVLTISASLLRQIKRSNRPAPNHAVTSLR